MTSGNGVSGKAVRRPRSRKHVGTCRRKRRLAPGVTGLCIMMMLATFVILIVPSPVAADPLRICQQCPNSPSQCEPNCGSIPPATYTYEGPAAIEIDNTYIEAGQSITLSYHQVVPVQAPEVVQGDLQSWVSTGLGKFACPTCMSTTFTAGSGGYIYVTAMDGSDANWAGYVLFGSGDYPTADLTITLPSAASLSGPNPSIVSLWVGLGGAANLFADLGGNAPCCQSPFWQAGVMTGVAPSPFVSLWYEGFADSSHYDASGVPVASPTISWGDTVTISLSFVSGGGYVCFSVAQTSSGCFTDPILQGKTYATSLEWVAEAPSHSINGATYTLPDFGPVTFSGLGGSALTGEVYPISLYTGFQGYPADTSGQTLVPGPFSTGDFFDGYTTSYSGFT